MIYVFTSNVNWFDNLRTPACPVDHNVKYLCFTNLPKEVLPQVWPWEYVHIDSEMSGARTSRLPKILAHRYLPADAEYSLYHDCNFQLRVDPNQVIHELLDRETQWAAHRHPGRTCIYDEARIILRDCPLVNPDDVNRQAAQYRAEGFPEQAGLWANGFIVRRHTPETQQLNELWWRLFAAGCERDQLSFPVARRALNVPIRTIEADVWASPYILFRWHAAWKERDDNPDYREQRAEMRQRLTDMGFTGFPEY